MRDTIGEPCRSLRPWDLVTRTPTRPAATLPAVATAPVRTARRTALHRDGAACSPAPRGAPCRAAGATSAGASSNAVNGQVRKPVLEVEGYNRTPVRAPSNTRLRIFSGTSHPELSKEVAHYLGMKLGEIKIKKFADGEIYVQLQESVRGCDVFLIQPTCPPTNESLMELMIMIDAAKRASARSITAVIPYYGYARADRKASGRESIAAKLTANLLTSAGCNRVLAVDLHSAQCVGYFDIPVDHVYGSSVLLDYLASKRIPAGELVVVSPDVGGVARARAFAKKLNDAPLAIVDKRRSAHNVSEVMNLIGDVEGKVAVLVDDMIDTAGTITNAGNQNLIFLDIRNNPIQDPQYKVLYGLLMNNSSILRIEYTLMEEKNLEMIEEFKSLQEQGYTSLSASQHLEHLAHEHHHRPTPLWQKICFPIWCWKSLIHDKHEAFRFKYDTESIRRLEETMMKSVKH